ncbi:CDP-alcohol phosphatidyltransferase family protein [Bradyrhizobium sp. sGM-13]|uniref:CDP-alcohol phosphatidyltransferase family protein n=1 Tax=Bradyrhizobium sp. sGM-13 TaxID=2831781 RepID=UPI001BCBBFB5|nr:CDP-alcohol phosphatidyltransferase family protein [Bradyrhizobium sp. sGM-13]
MLRYLLDPANAITSLGILFSGLALHAVLAGRLELAVAIGLWSMLADQLDGIVAKRTPNRGSDVAEIGKSLDGLGDVIYGAVLPAVVIMALGEGGLVATSLGIFMICAGALRLSYFSRSGLTGGYFTGVPLSYDVPLLAIFFMTRRWFPAEVFNPAIMISFFLLTWLHVSSIKVPAPGRAMYLVITAFSAVSSAILVSQAVPFN